MIAICTEMYRVSDAKVFIDANAWVARFNPRDNHYGKAKPIWDALLEERWPLVTTDWTLFEALTLLRLYRFEAAQECWAFSRSVSEILPGDTVKDRAIELFFKYYDQTFSVVDCANFVAIQERSCRQVFSFDDRHFRPAEGIFGFKLLY